MTVISKRETRGITLQWKHFQSSVLAAALILFAIRSMYSGDLIADEVVSPSLMGKPLQEQDDLYKNGASCGRFLSSFSSAMDRQGQSSVRRPVSLYHWWWARFSDLIVRESLRHDPLSDDEDYRQWISKYVFPFYNTGRMKRSSTMPMDRHITKRLLDVINNFETTKEPLRIYVLGGSVTFGTDGCSNPFLSNSRFKRDPSQCAWSFRLENILNHFFAEMYDSNDEPSIGEVPRRVEIINMAVPGTSSDTGAMALQYRLFKDRRIDPSKKPPHLVLLAYSANDSRTKTGLDVELFMNEIVNAARSLRPCDDLLPAVGFVNDFFPVTSPMGKDVLHNAFRHSGVLYSHASWQRLWMLDYAAVVQHSVLGNVTDPRRMEPLMGAPINVHMGAGSHSGIAWMILFNLFEEIIEMCDAPEPLPEDSGPSLMVREIDEGKTQYKLDRPGKEPTSKYLGKIQPDMMPYEIALAHGENVKRKEELCSGGAGNPTDSDPVCSYAWMVNKMAGINTPLQLDRRIKPVLVQADGWTSSGSRYVNPRTGWYAQKAGATFKIKVQNISVDTKYLTILSMKSYGPLFAGSKVELRVSVRRDGKLRNESEGNVFQIDGHHTETTSVHFPHKFRLAGDGAKKGDSIELGAKMIGGSTFKMAGLALCRF